MIVPIIPRFEHATFPWTLDFPALRNVIEQNKQFWSQPHCGVVIVDLFFTVRNAVIQRQYETCYLDLHGSNENLVGNKWRLKGEEILVFKRVEELAPDGRMFHCPLGWKFTHLKLTDQVFVDSNAFNVIPLSRAQSEP
jgi:hypothetical protein